MYRSISMQLLDSSITSVDQTDQAVEVYAYASLQVTIASAPVTSEWQYIWLVGSFG